MLSERGYETTTDVLEARAPTLDDEYMTAADLAKRWCCDTATLANLRSRGDGLPFVKRGHGGHTLYRVADVLAAEASGTRGFSWARLEAAVDSFDGFRAPKDRALFLEHVRSALRT